MIPSTERDPTEVAAAQSFQDLIQGLVRDASVLHAIKAGEIDAIIDPANGNPIMLSDMMFDMLTGLRKQVQMSAVHAEVISNTLLAALPAEDYQQLLAKSETVTLTCGDTLYQSGKRIKHVYFPEDSIVSLLTQVKNHRSLETGLIGFEGMVGVPIVLGARVSVSTALVQGTGTAVRIDAAHFRQVLLQSVQMQKTLYRFVHVLMSQIGQTVACNHFHRVEARLARWLLMTRDRSKSNNLYLTHTTLSGMLGARREGITAAASALQRSNLISYSRGHIRIMNRRGLESAACVCYRIIKKMALNDRE